MSEPCQELKSYIPEPQPVTGPVELTALYYPGTEQMAEWDQVEQTLPHIKPLLGWYDEGNPENIDWQIKWAVEHGISSFCVDWYWNRGQQRLDHWVKGYYKARFRHYLKWYIMWANHNQPGAHSTEDMVNVTRFWIDSYFKTPEYYTIDGKPVVVLWSAPGLDRDFIAEAAEHGETLKQGEGLKRALDISRDMAKAAGLPDIYFMCMYHRWDSPEELTSYTKMAGCQALMMYNFGESSYCFTPEQLGTDNNERSFSFALAEQYVGDLWKRTALDPEHPVWPILPCGWNDLPRSFQYARICRDRTPEAFGRICRACREFCVANGVKRAVVAPVNEWQEGTYIEPNEEYGFAMVDALRDAFCDRPAAGWPSNLTPGEAGRPLHEYPPMEHPDKTSWDFREDVQGWYRNPYGTAFIKIVDHSLNFFRSGSLLAALRTRIKPFDAAAFKSFTVRMKATPNFSRQPDGSEKVKLTWGTPEFPVFGKDLVVQDAAIATAPLIADGEWHDYTLCVAGNPAWKGMVEELWFDPGYLPLATFDIAWMRFE